MGWIENIVGKGEHAGYQHVLLFLTFSKGSFSGSFKVEIVWERVKDKSHNCRQVQWKCYQCVKHAGGIVQDRFDNNNGKKEKMLITCILPFSPDFSSTSGIHAICPGLSGTVPDFDILFRRHEKYEIVPEILKNKVDQFFKTNLRLRVWNKQLP